MAFYLPVLSAIVIGVSLLQGAISVAVAVGRRGAHPLRRAAARAHRVAPLPRRPVRAAAARRARAHDARRRPRGPGGRLGGGRGVPRGHRAVGPGRREREPGAHPAARPLRRHVLRVLRPHERLVGRSSPCCCRRSRWPSSRSSRSSSPAPTPPGAPASARSASGAPGSRSRRAASSRSSSRASPSRRAWRPAIAPLATGYVLITIIAGTFLARLPDAAWFRAAVRRRAAARPAAGRRRLTASPAGPVRAVDGRSVVARARRRPRHPLDRRRRPRRARRRPRRRRRGARARAAPHRWRSARCCPSSPRAAGCRWSTSGRTGSRRWCAWRRRSSARPSRASPRRARRSARPRPRSARGSTGPQPRSRPMRSMMTL